MNAIALRSNSAGFPARLIDRFRAWMDEPVGFDATAPSPSSGRDWADRPVHHPQFPVSPSAQLAPEPINAAEHLCGTAAFLGMSTNAARTLPVAIVEEVGPISQGAQVRSLAASGSDRDSCGQPSILTLSTHEEA